MPRGTPVDVRSSPYVCGLCCSPSEEGKWSSAVLLSLDSTKTVFLRRYTIKRMTAMIKANIPLMMPRIKPNDDEELDEELATVLDPLAPSELDALALLLDVATLSLRQTVTS
jgi:hypothetical protein